MKNKRLVIIISIIIFVVAILIICSNIFVLKKVNIKLENNSSISQELQREICTNKVFKKNSNIIFINKQNIISTLEKEYPSLMIESIETQFPNKLLIHATERKEVYYVKNNSTSYIALDKTLKVLYEYTEQPNLTQLIGVNVQEASIGSFVQNSSNVSIIKNFYSALDLCYYNETDVISLFKRVEIEDNNITATTNYNANVGTKIKIENPQNNLTKKIVYALSGLNALNTNQRTHGTILIQENINNADNIISSYIE